MTASLLCGAAALLTLPTPIRKHRLRALYGGLDKRRNMPRAWIIRGLAVATVIATIAFGPGPAGAAALAVATGVVRSRSRHRERRHDDECRKLLEGLDVVIGELRTGAHPGTAAAVAAGEIGGPVGNAFAVSAARARLGGSAAIGLRTHKCAVTTELGRVADAWEVAERHGLALADLLRAARADLAGRRRFGERTTAALAGARASAAVLAGLPLLGIALGQLMGAHPLQVLLGSGIGSFVLPLGTGLIAAGLLWADAITRRVTS
ncbi:type II secretion system F family protein [Nocardia nova]|uniref:type II secretion system F family protein n=1 Tax=Nocardia nova TaxID=37330 RepID=UPI0034083B7A